MNYYKTETKNEEYKSNQLKTVKKEPTNTKKYNFSIKILSGKNLKHLNNGKIIFK